MTSARRSGLVPYLCLLPVFLFYAPFVLVPFLHTAGLSLYDWDGLTPATFAGLDNYREAITSPFARAAFEHALVLVFFFGLLPVLLALPVAVAAARAPPAASRAIGGIALLPQAMSTVVVGVSWGWILALDGPFNAALRALGLGGTATDWLGSFDLALPSLGIVGTWTLTGLCVALFVAGLQQISPSLYDAAAVDGASLWRRFRAVSLPGLRGPIAVALTVTVVAALRAFDLVFVTTRGGPGTETIVPGLLIYRRAFEDGRLGSAAALAVVLAAVVFAAAWLINRVADRRSR